MRSSYLAPDPAFQFMGTAGQCLLFQDPGDSEGDVPCWAVMPAILIMNYSWDRLMELDDRALSKWLDLVGSPPGNPILWPRGIEACFWATSGSIAETEIRMHVIQCLGRHGSFWVSWHRVLVADPKTNRAIVKFSGVWSYWCFCGQDCRVISLVASLMGCSWSWTSLGFHHLLPGSHSSHKDIFLCGWMPNYYFQEKDVWKGHLNWPFCWHCSSHLDFHLLASRRATEHMCIVLSHPVLVLCYSTDRKLIHWWSVFNFENPHA